MTRRVAVVGSGVSGLVAAYVLAKHDHVTLFEADERLGGHADTHDVPRPGGGTIPIDTGFIVHNDRTYPTLRRLFAELDVPTQESDMSMSVSSHGLEYAGALGASGLFPSVSNATDPRYLRMLTEIPRFHRMARRTLADGADDAATDETLEAFLARGGFTDYFASYFMRPLVAAVWSCDPATALDYPARYLFAFLEHHGMLTVFGSPTWRTVTGGSREYVDRVAKNLHEVLLSTPVSRVTEREGSVAITTASGVVEFDAVVIATHPEQALALLDRPTEAQREVLGAMPYTRNRAILHTDQRLLPRAKRAWASWNYRCREDGPVLVTYDLNRLMRLPETGERYLVTLGDDGTIDPSTVLAEMDYAHPLYTPQSVAAQRRLPEINTARVAFAGAYHGWGFHEDGARSGLRAAEHLGGSWPESGGPCTPRIYETTVAHARTAPLDNRFRYPSNTWLVDLDDLPRYRGIRFEARDHVGDPDRSLRANIDELLAANGIERPDRVVMLAHPRTLGQVFNPISVFWCYRSGAVDAVVVEVHNTYSGRHAYVLQPDAAGHSWVDKQLYVSPFNDTAGRYEVRVPEPGDRLAVSVTLHRTGQPPFVATLRGQSVPVTAANVRRTTRRLAPLKGAIQIRRQGIGLWLRGLPIQRREGK